MLETGRSLGAFPNSRAAGFFSSARASAGVSDVWKVAFVKKLNRTMTPSRSSSLLTLGFRRNGALLTSMVVLGLQGCGHYGIDYGGETRSDGSTPFTDDTGTQSSANTDNSPSKPSTVTSNDDRSEKPDKPRRDAGPTKDGEAGMDPSTGDVASDSSGVGSGGASTSAFSSKNDSSADSVGSDDAGVLDAGEMDDGGAATTMDASMDANAPDDTTDLAVDAGNPLCDPNCACLFDQCELSCLQAECLATCEPGVECQIAVGPAEVLDLLCNAGAVCTAGDILAPRVEVVCRGEGECRTECTGDQSCDVSCEGSGRCETKCHDQATCSVTCAEGRECYVTYDDIENAELTCEGGVAKTCDGFLTCNESCP